MVFLPTTAVVAVATIAASVTTIVASSVTTVVAAVVTAVSTPTLFFGFLIGHVGVVSQGAAPAVSTVTAVSAVSTVSAMSTVTIPAVSTTMTPTIFFGVLVDSIGQVSYGAPPAVSTVSAVAAVTITAVAVSAVAVSAMSMIATMASPAMMSVTSPTLLVSSKIGSCFYLIDGFFLCGQGNGQKACQYNLIERKKKYKLRKSHSNNSSIAPM